MIQDSHEKVIGDNGAGMADHELILVEMILPRRYGGDKDARQPSNPHRNQEETKRLQYHDHKFPEPLIKEQFTKTLKDLSGAATVTINELLDTTPQNTSRSQTKADGAFEAVRTAGSRNSRILHEKCN